jgi:hypothetical protein
MAGTLSASEHPCSVLDSSPARTALSSVGRLEQAGIADFLLGHFNRSEGQVGAPIANFRSGYYALYVQDSWKVRPTLTINYGLRWEYDQPFYDTNDNIVNIDFKWDNSAEPVFVRAGTGDPYEGNPAFRLAPDVQYVRDGRFGRGAYRSDFNDIAPRLGIAWTVTPKTVLRTGGGIYYVRDIGNAVFDIVRNAPFTIRRDEPAESFRPNLSYEQPFARTGAPTFILANQYDEPSSYIAQWSLGAKRFMLGRSTSSSGSRSSTCRSCPSGGSPGTSFERQTSASSTARDSIRGRFSWDSIRVLTGQYQRPKTKDPRPTGAP